MFKVEIRKTCLICNNALGYRQRTYCSTKCRNRAINQRHKGQQAEWQKKRRDEIASKPSPLKIKCHVCNKYYVQVGSHIVQVHGMTAREYRKEYGFDVKRGQVPEWYRQMKEEQCKENGTVKNLKHGKKVWFTPGDKKAGKYERSPQTIERLKNLHKLNKRYE